MTVIDLGELRDDAEPELPPRPRAAGRPVRFLLALLFALVTLAGAVPQPARTALIVPARAGADAFVLGDRLFVFESFGQEPGGPRELTAYALPDAGTRAAAARSLWRTSVHGGADVVGIQVRDGTVLLTGPSTDGDSYTTAAFDATTGRPRWRQPGVALASTDGVLLQSVGGEGRGGVRVVDPVTGQARWTLTTPPQGVIYRYREEGIDRIVVVPYSGEFEVWDARSGTKLHSRNVRPGQLPSYQRAQVVDDLLLAVGDSSTTVTAYGLDGLDRRWEARLSLVAYVAPCANLLCVFGQIGGVTVLDPATGRTRWSDRRWESVLRDRDGRLLVSGLDPSRLSTFAVLDAATGQVLADLGSWDLISWDGPDDPVLGLRRAPEGRLVIAELDLTAGRAQVRDTLRDVLGDCQVDGGTLLCRRRDGAFGLWRLAG